MTGRCDNPVGLEMLIDYWAGDLIGQDLDRIEEHLFGCADCAAQLDTLASLRQGLATIVREGRLLGIISRALFNRMQREGLRVRSYALSPGETVPCAVFPGDDLVVVSLRADFTGVQAVRLTVTGPGNPPTRVVDEVPVSTVSGEVLWATPGAYIFQLPSARVRLTLTSADATGALLGEYVLDHSASETQS